jgi:hypothetical protein
MDVAERAGQGEHATSRGGGNDAGNSRLKAATTLRVISAAELDCRTNVPRAEIFNLLNRSNFRAPNGDRSSAAFGAIMQRTIRAKCSLA